MIILYDLVTLIANQQLLPPKSVYYHHAYRVNIGTWCQVRNEERERKLIHTLWPKYFNSDVKKLEISLENLLNFFDGILQRFVNGAKKVLTNCRAAGKRAFNNLVGFLWHFCKSVQCTLNKMIFTFTFVLCIFTISHQNGFDIPFFISPSRSRSRYILFRNL